ncbi:MAG: SDR family NAD(P)-dependent oxidoreductase [Verrucomicrobiota bacterium]|nr:SDR family NAD(P)-dependent oxidoreductase [Verrucomicrobiota bacterium]
MSRFDFTGCTALITGASAGLGAEFARQLSERAGTIVLVARREDRLNALRDELIARAPNLKVAIRATDLANAAEIDALCVWLQRENIAIDLLINNAGLGDLGPFGTSDARRVEAMVKVNVGALTALTHRLLPPMIERRQGAILNVSSSAGFLPIAGMAVYAATKAYVTSFSEALRTELHGSGVQVTALCPGPVHTEFTSVANRTAKAGKFAPEFTHVSAAAVVRAALHAIERNQPSVVPGIVMKLSMLLVRLTPMPVLRLAARASARD